MLGACTTDDQPPGPATVPEPERQALPTGEEDEDRLIKVNVYYLHPYIQGIFPREKMIFKTERVEDLVKQVIDHLTIAPSDGFGSPVWPELTYIREVYALGDGTLVVDFNGQFINNLQVSIVEEELLVYSLVNTLLEHFEQFKKVHILVDGSVQETLLGHIDIEFPLAAGGWQYVIRPEDQPYEEIEVEELGPITEKQL